MSLNLRVHTLILRWSFVGAVIHVYLAEGLTLFAGQLAKENGCFEQAWTVV
jgi:hypothetical protein